ncbi:MAG: AbrB/MazE/SpoVT family DNA-binding domain-containing protein [Deltaproteobacteria bacterium]|nr:AbrB/MazE/SpoVT family DNA-binding domain-containing protein [Deltaproteobacteria bacterium]
MSTGITKLFNNGGSQAVRLPKEFRFKGEEVIIRHYGNGVLLEPYEPNNWPPDYWALMPTIKDNEWERPIDQIPKAIEDEFDWL